jgi:hypothetical protein
MREQRSIGFCWFCRHVLWAALFTCMVAIAAGSACAGTGGWLSQHHDNLCRAHGGVDRFGNTGRIVADAATCTMDCFSYTLACRDGQQLTLTARYRPEASDNDIFFHESSASGTVKLLIFALLAFFAFVAIFGAKVDRQRAIVQNAAVLGIAGFTLWMWGVAATLDGFSQSEFFDVVIAPLVKYLIIPLFVIVSIPSFARGWNYLFVAHPAAPIVGRGMRGKSIDVEGLAGTLADGAHDSGVEATYHYEHQAEKARALAEKLNADAAAAEARAERERRRAELAEANRLLEDARRRSERNR